MIIYILVWRIGKPGKMNQKINKEKESSDYDQYKIEKWNFEKCFLTSFSWLSTGLRVDRFFYSFIFFNHWVLKKCPVVLGYLSGNLTSDISALKVGVIIILKFRRPGPDFLSVFGFPTRVSGQFPLFAFQAFLPMQSCKTWICKETPGPRKWWHWCSI